MTDTFSSKELSSRGKALLAAGVVAFAAILIVVIFGGKPAPQQPAPSAPATVSAPRPGLTLEQELTLEALEASTGIGVQAQALSSAQAATLRVLEAKAGISRP